MSLALRDACLGIIELAHPNTRPAIAEDYKKAFQSIGVVHHEFTEEELLRHQFTWAHVFKVC